MDPLQYLEDRRAIGYHNAIDHYQYMTHVN